MQCPNCQTENPELKKFCRECGTKLTSSCPQCDVEVIPGDKFCGECGFNLRKQESYPGSVILLLWIS